MKVYLALTGTNETTFTDELARKEAVMNGISVLTRKELGQLIDDIRKKQIDPTTFVEYLKKKIPKK